MESATRTVSIELPEEIFSALRKDPEAFVSDMRLAAAVKWYELGEISQEKAAHIAGLPRARFLEALARFKVSVFQYTAAEIESELRDAD